MLTLRPYQQAAIASIYGYFEKESGNPLVVIPTAGGKSLVMAAFIDGVLKAWPDQRVLVVTHVRELIAQNHAEMLGLWPEASAGIYSAGLGRRDARARILFAGIQSIHDKATRIGHADLVLIDEAHLIPGGRTPCIAASSPTCRRSTRAEGDRADGDALPARQRHAARGRERALHRRRLRGVGPRPDRSGLSLPAHLEADEDPPRRDRRGIAGWRVHRARPRGRGRPGRHHARAVAEVIAHGETRRSWLAFCSGVRHATHVAEEFRRRGVSCATIFGKTPKDERDAIIAAFKRGEIRALASMGVLTTGFNAPAVDLIAMLRPTKSAGLYVQMAGRGTRLAEGKENCLVLDFAGNVRRHGPIDLVRPKRPGGPGDGPPPTKICPKCGTIVAIAALECPDCGFEFPGREVKLEPTASTLEVLSTGKPQWVAVTDVTYSRHEKRGGRVSLKVTYRCGLAFHTEWVCFEHEGYPRRKAASWWRERAPELEIPASVDEALILADRLRRPTEIAVRPAAASPKSPPTGSPHALRLCRALRRLPSRTPRLGLVRRALPHLRPAARHEPQRPLQPGLPGHLSPEVGHDRSDPQ
ncbi:MAG: DEAD/DEAH box helicase family protein [Rhodobacteraceae bacterium]|nr:DEAD/DEAH box helicase family protein [Paracoccaceae bacterium]